LQKSRKLRIVIAEKGNFFVTLWGTLQTQFQLPTLNERVEIKSIDHILLPILKLGNAFADVLANLPAGATLLSSGRMLYTCKYCRLPPEEIVGDNSPRCMRCGSGPHLISVPECAATSHFLLPGGRLLFCFLHVVEFTRSGRDEWI
jgi:hypothetical protein